jgi:hypothetical protein
MLSIVSGSALGIEITDKDKLDYELRQVEIDFDIKKLNLRMDYMLLGRELKEKYEGQELSDRMKMLLDKYDRDRLVLGAKYEKEKMIVQVKYERLDRKRILTAARDLGYLQSRLKILRDKEDIEIHEARGYFFTLKMVLLNIENLYKTYPQLKDIGPLPD